MARVRIPRAALLILIAAGVAAAGVWQWFVHTRLPELDPDWRPIVRVIAGDGVAAMRDGDIARARFSDPFGVAAGPDGVIYVADAGDAQRIRRIAADGTVTTIAGGELGFADGAGTAGRFNTPSGIALGGDGALYVADTANNAIRRVTPDGTVSTVAGTGLPGYQDGSASAAQFNGPIGVAVDASGRLIVADTYNDRIRAIHPDGTVVTLAGSGQPGALDGAVHEASFHTPCGVAVDGAGNIYVADSGNSAVRVIAPSGFVSTVEPLPAEGLFRPVAIAVTPNGLIYVTDDRGRIVEIAPGVRARAIAGSAPGFADGEGETARFRGPMGLAIERPGRLIVTDPRNAVVRLVADASKGDLRLPGVPVIRPNFAVETFAREPLLWPLLPMDGPFEIAGTLGEFRGSEGAERLHSGVDIYAFQGTPVVAVRPASVSHPISTGDFGSLNEWLRIGPIAYVHVRAGRLQPDDLVDTSRFAATYDDMERITLIRLKRGARFETGETIGSTNPFNHVHLNVGWSGEEYNPLQFRLAQFEDTVPPRIAPRGIRLFDQNGDPITRRKNGRLILDGVVSIVVDAWDQVDGNEARRRLGLYELGYQVLRRDGTPAPGFDTMRETIRFDRLATGSDAARTVYAAGSGIPFFGRRRTRFLYVVTNRLSEGVATVEGWDTTTLQPGDYTLRIHAADANGNVALANRDVPVTIATPSAAAAVR